MTMPAETAADLPPGPSDDESRLWLQRLGSSGAERDAAMSELHALLFGRGPKS